MKINTLVILFVVATQVLGWSQDHKYSTADVKAFLTEQAEAWDGTNCYAATTVIDSFSNGLINNKYSESMLLYKVGKLQKMCLTDCEVEVAQMLGHALATGDLYNFCQERQNPQP